jgi:hypothetical protein
LVDTSTSSWDAQGNLLAIDFDGGAFFLRLGQPVRSIRDMSLDVAVGNKPGVDETKGDGVGTNTERTPLLGEGFGKTNNCRLGSSIVSLANVSVKTRDRRNVDDGTVLRITLTQHEYQRTNGEGGTRTLMRI